MKAYINSIEYVLPFNVVKNPIDRRTKKIGVFEKHICSEQETASDLAYRAAEKVFTSGISKKDIDFIILCTQSPDYNLPTTACILQDRLGLPTHCGAFDYNLGCSGYIYGLGIVKGLIETGLANNVLLITAETYSKYIHPLDNSVKPVFGDGAAATIVTGYDRDESGLNGFVFGTDGSGYSNLIVPVGGMRQRYHNTEIEETIDQYNNFRTNRNLYMDGLAISNFALDVVPKTVEQILSQTGLSKNDIDYYVFHQANKLMLEYLQEKCNLKEYPYWNDIKNYGNTVSSSIPIALKNVMKNSNKENINKVLCLGFGVGLSWGGCVIDMNKFSL